MTTKKNSDPNFATARAPKPPASHEDEDISNGDLVWGFMNSTRPGELQWSPGVGFNEKGNGGKMFPHVLINGEIWVMLYDFGEWSLITKPKADDKQGE